MQTGLIPFTPNGSAALSASRYVLPGGYDADPDRFPAGETAAVVNPASRPQMVELMAEAADVPPGSDPLIARLRATIERAEDELTQVYAELERAWAALEEVRGTTADTLPATETNASSVENLDTAADLAQSPTVEDPSEVAETGAATLEELPERDVASAADDPQPLDEQQPLPAQENTPESHTDDQPPRAGMKISARHRQAAHMLASGARTINVARAVGVSRNTVQTWKRDAGFQALLNSHVNELRESAQARLLASANSAVSVLVNKVLAGDTKVSLQLLKGLGLLTGKPQEPGCERIDELECNEK